MEYSRYKINQKLNLQLYKSKMFKMKKIIQISMLMLIFVTFLVGCQSIQMSDLRPPKSPISGKLPSLEPNIDVNSLHAAYSFGTTVGSGSATGYETTALGGVIGTSVFTSQQTAVADKRIQDFIVLFEREVRDNITVGDYDSKGKAVARIIIGETKVGGFGWFLLSCLTLTVPNWFGMPLWNYVTELELEVVIKDCNDKVIGRFQGYGRSRVPVAAWHGYDGGSLSQITGTEDAVRMSNIRAINMAMAEIKAKIEHCSFHTDAELFS